MHTLASRAGSLVALAAIVSACGGAMIILKSPIADQCQKTGLRGCELMTEGVLLVIEGDKANGLKKIAAGAADNAPGDVKKFAIALESLKAIPGTSEFMGPVFEVIATSRRATLQGTRQSVTSKCNGSRAARLRRVSRLHLM